MTDVWKKYKDIFIIAVLIYILESTFWITNYTITRWEISGRIGMLYYMFSPKIILVSLLGAITAALLYHFVDEPLEKLFKYRYALVSVIFIVCVIFGISGSSVGMWCNYIDSPDEDVLLGVSRAIRTDEWKVATPMLFSQYHNSKGLFPYFSDTVRAAHTDVYFEYGQPVRNILVLFRPFYWGYLVLPIANGMSFFWMGRLLALFMISFEFGRLITGDKRSLSIAYSIMVTFSPVIQWWFATNGFVEMLCTAQLSIILFDKYLKTDDIKKRIGLMGVIAWSAGIYILTIYPAWQVPLGYVILGLIVWVIVENYKNLNITYKDIVTVIGCFAVLGAALLYFYHLSGDAIKVLSETEYPGSRTIVGGNMADFPILFNYISNIWIALLYKSNITNPCEAAQFISLFPLPIFFAAFYMLRSKKPDTLLCVMLAILCFLGLYITGFLPEIISKISLMGKSFDTRTMTIFGLINIVILVRSIALLVDENERERLKGEGIIVISTAVIFTVLVTWMSWKCAVEYGDKGWYLGIIVEALFLSGFAVVSVTRGPIYFLYVIAAVHIFSGVLVNPIRVGIDSIEQSEVIKDLSEIEKSDPDADWLVESEDAMNLGLLVGLDTVNSTNIYPEINRWKEIDRKGKNKTIYNRYAHIKVECFGQKTKFELIAPDSFKVYLTGEDMEKLGVDYILSEKKYENYKEMKSVGRYYIYEF